MCNDMICTLIELVNILNIFEFNGMHSKMCKKIYSNQEDIGLNLLLMPARLVELKQSFLV